MDMEVIFILFLFFLQFVMPAVIVIGLIWFFFVGRRILREKKSLDASKGDAIAMALEKDRIKARIINITAIILWPVTFGVVISMGIPFQIALLAAFICSGLCGWWAAKIKRRYSAGFKENFVKSGLSEVFDNLRYEPQGRFDNASLHSLDFFNTVDRVSGNDLIDAAYKGLHFAQCDLGVHERYTVTVSDKNGNTREEVRWLDVFKGRAMRFDFADKFRGKVQVVAKDFDGAKVKSSRVGWQTVETELAEFGKHFDVFATDPLDAMAVLTPQMIEGIFFMKQALDVPAAFYFIENTMVVFMETGREAFDVTGKHTLLEEKALLRRDIGLITGFMDVMYFKAQSVTVALSPATGDVRSETAAAVAAAIGPSGAEKIVHKTKRTVGKTVSKTLAFLPKAIIAVFLVSAAYGLIYLPGEIAAGTSSDSMMVPTTGYLIVMGIFLVPFALMHIYGGLFLLLVHILIMSANL
jgi:hypothetical protein